jgi:hypothetical protein
MTLLQTRALRLLSSMRLFRAFREERMRRVQSRVFTTPIGRSRLTLRG